MMWGRKGGTKTGGIALRHKSFSSLKSKKETGHSINAFPFSLSVRNTLAERGEKKGGKRMSCSEQQEIRLHVPNSNEER